MLRKSLYLLAAICMLATTMVPANVALAQKPEPPELGLEQPDGLPVIDVQNLPETVQQAAVLQESLTPEQHAAVRAILDKYLPEMQATTDALVAVGKPAADAEPEPVDRDIMARIRAMFKNIDAEMATVLDADQLALYRAVTQPPLPGDDAMPKPDNTAMPKRDDSPVGPQDYTSNCFYGARYNAYADAYAWLSYLYAYYDYYYYGYSYAYYTYYYAYQTYLYSKYALDYSGPTYFLYYYHGQYGSGYPYYAYYYSDYAENYGYYAYLYGYYNYYYYGSGSSYAYYAYAYAYYAYYGADYAHYYTYYCYYYS